MPELEVVKVPTHELLEYENNAKLHPIEQIDQIAQSIWEFGFNNPILAWHNNDGNPEIIAGHGRLLAARKLGMRELPVVFLDHMTEEQRRAYILVDNQLTMNSGFDFDILQGELDAITDIDMSQFDVSIRAASDWFTAHERNDDSRQEGNDEYNDFLDKFEAKKTTDDCYTPDLVYDAVADFVADRYKVDRSRFVRPFYPGGDYEHESYPKGCVVVDNPPFSILAEILRFYTAKGIKFFLFSPTLTLFSPRVDGICFVPVGVAITYDNGANVNTSFTTNLEQSQIHCMPDLYAALYEANRQSVRGMRKELPKYEFPSHVVTAAGLSRFSVHGVEFVAQPEECHKVSGLDAQKEYGKTIFGSGFLLSDGAALRNEDAERQKVEAKRNAELERLREATENPEVETTQDGTIIWKLSERELGIIANLGTKEDE